MGWLRKLFRGKEKEEEEVIKVLDELDQAEGKEREEENLMGSGNGDITDLEKQWLERRTESKETVEVGGKEDLEEEKKESSETEERVQEDELISSLKEAEEKEERDEMDRVLLEVVEELGNVHAKEILNLGREILSDMRGGGGG